MQFVHIAVVVAWGVEHPQWLSAALRSVDAQVPAASGTVPNPRRAVCREPCISGAPRANFAS